MKRVSEEAVPDRLGSKYAGMELDELYYNLCWFERRFEEEDARSTQLSRRVLELEPFEARYTAAIAAINAQVMQAHQAMWRLTATADDRKKQFLVISQLCLVASALGCNPQDVGLTTWPTPYNSAEEWRDAK